SCLYLEEDPTDYPADVEDDDDDDESSDDDDDEEQEAFEDDDEEKEEHPALADSSTLPVDAPVPSAEDTEAFEIDESAPTPVPSPRHRTDRMSVWPQTPMSVTTKALIVEYAFAPTPLSPPPSPLKIPSPPLLLQSTTHKDDLLEADILLWKRACFTAPTGRFKVVESSSADAARQAGHTLAYRVDYGFIDTMDTNIRASKSKAMTAIGEVNDKVTYLATTQRQDAQEIYVRCEDAQYDRALLRAQVSLLTRKRIYFSLMAYFYEHEAVITQQAWSHSESMIQAMEAQIRALQRDVDVLQRQRIRDQDRLTAQIQHEHNRFRDLVRATEACDNR
nr:hypothetical protein [Tanacetum cinerariifolium]